MKRKSMGYPRNSSVGNGHGDFLRTLQRRTCTHNRMRHLVRLFLVTDLSETFGIMVSFQEIRFLRLTFTIIKDNILLLIKQSSPMNRCFMERHLKMVLPSS